MLRRSVLMRGTPPGAGSAPRVSTSSDVQTMETILRKRTPLANAPLPQPTRSPDEDRTTRIAFYFLMGTLLASLIYFMLVPFFI